jgi:hypothetical protein
VQTLALHAGTGMLFVEHALPHPPQLLTSVVVLMLQPLVVIVPSQFANPVLHMYEHAPLVHTPVALGSEGQLPEQVAWHVPPTHSGVPPEQSLFVQHARHASPYAPPSDSEHVFAGPFDAVHRCGVDAGHV